METREIELQHNCPLRIERVGATIECTAGTIWVTSTAVAGDLFLHPGARHRLPGGTTLVEALGTARIVLHPPATRWRRILSAVWRFLLSYAHGRASQYSGIYLRVMQDPRGGSSLAG